MIDFLSLQNGSDIRGVALQTEGGKQVNLTEDVIFSIGAAFATLLAKKLDKTPSQLKIGVGTDSRLTAHSLKNAMLKGVISVGAVGFDCSLASTPAMFCSCLYPQTNFDGAVMLTASHLPYERNGAKFFDKTGGYDKPDIKAILELASNIVPIETENTATGVDLISLYCMELCEKIKQGVNSANYEKPLAGLKVVVDAGNGAGGFFADKVLSPLGADITGSCFLEPDGNFPNHQPNPENKEAMEAIKAATVSNKAHLGLIFDTDVDRMSAVLSDGEEVNRDAIIAMMAAIIAPENKGATIVTDSVTSDRLTKFLEQELGLVHLRFKRGYKNVINEAKRLNQQGVNSPLAIETSGHGALMENHFLDDGAYMAVKLLIAAAKAKQAGEDVAKLIAALPPLVEDAEIRIPITNKDFATAGKNALEQFEAKAAAKGYHIVTPSYEGVRITFNEGWALLRMSLHDPLLPLNIEGNKKGDVAVILGKIKELLADAVGIDLSVL